ncbi:MAG: helix-turn-helix transcriptional regulator [Lacisediminihabitans sp.]
MTLSIPRIFQRSQSAIALRTLALAGTAFVIIIGTAAELAAAPPRSGFDAPVVAYALGFIAVVGLIWIRRAPVAAAVICLTAVLTGHFLGIPGSASGMALFYAVFELARSGRRVPTAAAFVVPFVWAGALILPPGAVLFTAPGLFGPLAGMLWMAGTGIAVRRAQPTTIRETADRGPALISGIFQPKSTAQTASFSTLTPREREIVALVATGLSNTAIAGLLFLSPVTVKSHVTHAMGKLGTTTRAQLVARAHSEGLVAH